MSKIGLNKTAIKVFILAAGRGDRWQEYTGVPKQLATVKSEALLARIMRLLYANEIADVSILAHDERLRVAGALFVEPHESKWIVDTLLSTQKLWGERNIFLLGDVFYTEKAMHKIVQCENPIAVFGRKMPSQFTKGCWPEIFALSFNSDGRSELLVNAEYVRQKSGPEQELKLWQLYRELAGFPLFPTEAYRFERELFQSINDFTDDFDVPKEYDRFIYRYNLATSKNPLVRWSFNGWIHSLTFILSPFCLVWYALRRVLIKLGLWRTVRRFLPKPD